MVVSVNFYGFQRQMARAQKIKVPLSKKTRVTDVLRYIKERYPQLPLSEDVVTVTLKANDKIAFIPHIGGG
jgi:hypothetical protein